MSYSEDIEENSVPKRKRKCKRTPLLMEYLSKKKKPNWPKVKAKEKEGVTGAEFQKQFELFSNNEKQLDMKPQAKLKQGKRK